MNDNTTTLTDLYIWLHHRAEFLRQQKAAAGKPDQEQPTATQITPAHLPEQKEVYHDE